MITLLDNYDSFTYNLVHYFGELGVEVTVYRNDKVSVKQVMAEKPEAIIISPGPCDPDQAGISLELVKAAAGKIPLLGVCLGHQTIGQVFGGKIIKAPTLMHGKLSYMHHKDNTLFKGLPSPFEATRYHSLIIERETLPDCLQVIAHTSDDIIMAVRHKEYDLYGVQFHPESIASQHGHAILANFLSLAKIKHSKAIEHSRPELIGCEDISPSRTTCHNG